MALKLLANNNAKSVLAAGISASATVITVGAGAGALFPVPVSGQSYFKLTITDAATKTISEIMHVTSVTGDVMTVIRGQEGTTPRVWSTNDIVANLITAGTFGVLAQKTEALLIENNLSEISSGGNQKIAVGNLGLSGGLGTDIVGRLIGVQKITSSGTYTKTPGANFGIVEIVGGGGSGASPAQNGAGNTSGAGGGNSGCYAKVMVNLSSVSTVACTIGAGGIPLAQQDGSPGGDTSFGGFVTAKGGSGGLRLASSTLLNRIYGMAPLNSTFGIVSGATLLDFDCGRLGGDAFILTSGARAGYGGASRLGGQVFGPGYDTAGIDANTYGGGGSGVVASEASFGTNLLGGKGYQGVIIIYEFG
ncbi:TPA: hypothetical protein MI542_09240 [Klebsiella pneumoniae]|nr:hypothetical protein [Klebsiella pneumoniae]